MKFLVEEGEFLSGKGQFGNGCWTRLEVLRL